MRICLSTSILMFELPTDKLVKLPPPHASSQISLEEALAKRRSIRAFSSAPLALEEIGQLLWAAHGITEKTDGLRTAPSAGALYPLEIYVVMEWGVYHYLPHNHELTRTRENDLRRELWRAALRQECLREAPLVFIIAGVFERTMWKYGERAQRYVYMEAGHVAQNLLLEATALGLGAVPVGAFHDEEVEKVLKLPKEQSALYLIPVGRPLEKP
ncbi:MAG: SagB/ThcOx family dehydrogenase [candidate division KSB1 bacterium]|nr:SagB/ThcOx family dehydrogenase [candidate division KSB1 bacterium]MDZ7305091.1 SagB/ThcOx family dehydrogenase [candidate division KSB1 bacterium]MDZ7313408.1 SagB/ThcOx family dehydrogenase [candidate division KSB1 bacterium]